MEEKQEKIDQLSGLLESLKVKKKDLEVETQAGFMQNQNRNVKMLEQIEILYEKKLAIENKKYFEMEGTFEKLKRENLEEKTGLIRNN